jgi:hypothetical protein
MNELLRVYSLDKAKKYRCGVNKDGGYVLADLDGGYDCYISAGVSDEESFSRDFIEKYGEQTSTNGLCEYNSFAFDATIYQYPYEYTNKISFIKKNIGPANTANETNLSYLMDKYRNIFLKMDIEGGEYPWLNYTTENQLGHFKQIVIEFHGITNDGWNCANVDKIACLQKLANTHYLVHAHGNNFGPVVNGIPDVIELTFVNKNYFEEPPGYNREPMPILGLDYPNNLQCADISLHSSPFVTFDPLYSDYFYPMY